LAKKRKIILLLALATGLIVGGAIIYQATRIREKMILIPAGSFFMGCNVTFGSDCEPPSSPQREIFLDAFWLDEHEATVAEYRRCVKAGACRAPQTHNRLGLDEKWQRYDFAYTWDKKNHDDFPVNGVEWKDAETYCRWRKKRLPAEAEFEKALRGGLSNQEWPWGGAPSPPKNFGNFQDESGRRHFTYWRVFDGYDDGWVASSPVCSFKKNPFGLCDIAGNMTEWCRDYYDPNWYAKMPSKNPVDTTPSGYRVLRGGGWRGTPRSNHSYFRDQQPEQTYLSSIGFRCAKDAAPEKP